MFGPRVSGIFFNLFDYLVAEYVNWLSHAVLHVFDELVIGHGLAVLLLWCVAARRGFMLPGRHHNLCTNSDHTVPIQDKPQASTLGRLLVGQKHLTPL